MLTIIVPGHEFYDEELEEFVSIGEQQLSFEHSLISLSKWESFWEKPFLGKDVKTTEEVNTYVQFMCLTPDVPPEVFLRLSKDNLEAINKYINAKMTATWFCEAVESKSSNEVITSELIYYWLVALAIPFQCETWHLERMFTLIKVVNLKNSPAKKMGRGEANAQRRALNQKRKQQYGTNG